MAVTPTHAHNISRSEATAWRNAVVAFFTVCGLSIGSWMSRLPTVGEQLGIGTGEIGTLLFLFSMSSASGLLLSPPSIKRFGSRAVLAVSFTVLGLGFAFTGIAVTFFGNFALTAIGMLIFGLGLGMGDVTMNLSGAINEKVLGRTVMPFFHAFFSVGIVLGSTLSSVTETFGVTIAAQSIGVGAVIAVSGLLASRFVGSEKAFDDPSEVGPTPTLRERARIIFEPRVLLIGLVVVGMAFTEGSASDWMSVLAVDGHGFTRPEGALLLSLFMVCMTVGRLLGGRAIDRFGRVRMLQASAVMAAVGLSLVVFTTPSWLVITGIVLWGFGAALGYPTGISAAADDPRNTAARVSTIAMFGWLAFLVGPPIIGFLSDQIGILPAFIPILGLILVAMLASPATRRPAYLDEQK